MVAVKAATLPAVTGKTSVVNASPAREFPDPLATAEHENETRPLGKTLSGSNVKDHFKRSLSARGIIRSPSLPATVSLQQTRSESGGKARTGADATKPRTASLLSLSGLRGSPAVSPLPSPTVVASPQSALPSTLEASYVSKASLRVNEAVNHVFPIAHAPTALHAGVSYKGRHAPNPERAQELAALLVSEVKACMHDQYLLKTFMRSAMTKAMSILLSRIEGLMILPTSEPTLLSIPLNARSAAPNPAQRFAFEVVRCAYEVRRGMEDAIDLENATAAVEEGFRPWVAKLDAVSSRTVGPLMVELKKELVKRVGLIGVDEHPGTHPVHLRGLALGRPAVPPSPDAAPLRDLADMLDACSKLTHSIHCPEDEEKWTVGLATTVIWKGMLTLVTHNMASSLPHEGEAGHAKRTLLPSKNGKRSPSPPLNGHSTRLRMPQGRFLHDAETLHSMIVRFTDHVGRLAPIEQEDKQRDLCSGCHFCAGTVLPDDLTSDSDSDGEDPRRLAQEALHEALLALASLTVALRACASGSPGAVAVRAGRSGPCATLRRALDTCPPLVLLHLLASQIPRERGLRLPHQIWGVGWTEYDGSLRGFASGEEWTAEVALEMLREVRRLRDEAKAVDTPIIGSEGDWLAALEEQARIHAQE